MRVSRSTSAAISITLVAWLAPLVSGISVPTGKLTPITPAKPTPISVNPRAPRDPAPVVEYSAANPEPPPLDPSYVPPVYNYFNTLARHHVYYVPVTYRNFNGAYNSIDYEPPQKFNSHILGKNFDYKPYKQRWAQPPSPATWGSQYNNQNTQYSNQNTQYSNQITQYSSPNPQYNNQNTQYSNQNTQYNNQNQYDSQNNQYTSQSTQFAVQPTPQQQQYEVVSPNANSAPSTVVPTPQNPSPTPQVDYTTGKGSYDVTGKGGSGSEFYTKADWSKKSFPKKVLAPPGKYHKY